MIEWSFLTQKVWLNTLICHTLDGVFDPEEIALHLSTLPIAPIFWWPSTSSLIRSQVQLISEWTNRGKEESHKYYVAGDIWFFHLNEYVFGHLDLSHCRNHSLVIRYTISCVENYQIWALILWSFERIFDWISTSFSLSLTRENVSYVHLNRSLCIWLSSTHAFSYSMFNKIFKHSQTHFNIVHTHTNIEIAVHIGICVERIYSIMGWIQYERWVKKESN